MEKHQKTLVTKWFPEKGFGFVAVDGRRAFVHVSDIEPWQERGTDLSGKTLVVYATEEAEKGFRVTRAATLEEHEKTLAAEAERQKRREEQRIRLEKGHRFLKEGLVLLREEMAKSPLKSGWEIKLLQFTLSARVSRHLARVVSLNQVSEEIELEVTSFASLTLSDERGWLELRELAYEEVLARTSDWNFSWYIPESDSLYGEVRAVLNRRREEERFQDFAGHLGEIGVALEKIGSPLDPKVVFRRWSRDYQEWSRCAQLEWTGERILSHFLACRDKERETALAEVCKTAGLEAYDAKWLGYFADTSSYRDADGDWQTIDHGTSHVRYAYTLKPWAKEVLERITAADKASGFAKDLSVLAETEVRPFVEAREAEERRIQAEHAEAGRIRKIAELEAAGLRAEEARLAAADKSEEKRLRDIFRVRQDWRKMLGWVTASGGYRGLHADAKEFLERIRKAQYRAEGLARARGYRIEQRRAEKEARQKQAEKDGFLSRGAWGALDNLKL